MQAVLLWYLQQHASHFHWPKSDASLAALQFADLPQRQPSMDLCPVALSRCPTSLCLWVSFFCLTMNESPCDLILGLWWFVTFTTCPVSSALSGKFPLLSWSRVQISREEIRWFCFGHVLLYGLINELLLQRWVHSRNHTYGARVGSFLRRGYCSQKMSVFPTRITVSDVTSKQCYHLGQGFTNIIKKVKVSTGRNYNHDIKWIHKAGVVFLPLGLLHVIILLCLAIW